LQGEIARVAVEVTKEVKRLAAKAVVAAAT
jgi:hypothetical protein